MPISSAEAPTQQPSVDSQLGRSYITTRQIQNDANIFVCSLDSEAHEYLKNHFNERLNDKMYSTSKELFGNINR